MGKSAPVPHRGQRGERLHGGFGDGDLVGPADEVVRRILADISNGCDPGSEGSPGVFKPGREPDHVVADVGLDGH